MMGNFTIPIMITVLCVVMLYFLILWFNVCIKQAQRDRERGMNQNSIASLMTFIGHKKRQLWHAYNDIIFFMGFYQTLKQEKEFSKTSNPFLIKTISKHFTLNVQIIPLNKMMVLKTVHITKLKPTEALESVYNQFKH